MVILRAEDDVAAKEFLSVSASIGKKGVLVTTTPTRHEAGKKGLKTMQLPELLQLLQSVGAEDQYREILGL